MKVILGLEDPFPHGSQVSAAVGQEASVLAMGALPMADQTSSCMTATGSRVSDPRDSKVECKWLLLKSLSVTFTTSSGYIDRHYCMLIGMNIRK